MGLDRRRRVTKKNKERDFVMGRCVQRATALKQLLL